MVTASIVVRSSWQKHMNSEYAPYVLSKSLHFKHAEMGIFTCSIEDSAGSKSGVANLPIGGSPAMHSMSAMDLDHDVYVVCMYYVLCTGGHWLDTRTLLASKHSIQSNKIGISDSRVQPPSSSDMKEPYF